MKEQIIPLNKIRSAQTSRGHRELSQAKIAKYARWKTTPPPIKVLVHPKFAGVYYISDGHHRVEAARLRGQTEINAIVEEVTL